MDLWKTSNAVPSTFSGIIIQGSIFSNSTGKMRLNCYQLMLIVGETAVGSTNRFSIQSNGILASKMLAGGVAISQVLYVIPGLGGKVGIRYFDT